MRLEQFCAFQNVRVLIISGYLFLLFSLFFFSVPVGGTQGLVHGSEQPSALSFGCLIGLASLTIS